ncbi:MAG TPA: hypothetical protein VF765_25770 [Polyangiaceae bacterium]
MKLGMIALPAAMALTALSADVLAAPETRTDVETDHPDAFDDGGPRSFALLTNPASLLFGAIGAEGDLLLGDVAAVSLEADVLAAGPVTGASGSLGVPLFPQGVALHGFYLHPRLFAAHAWSAGSHADVAGIGATLGWEWTLPVGFTVRVGAGAAIDRPIGGDASAVSALTGFRPLLDGALGWAF